jgi:hypothetical protein
MKPCSNKRKLIALLGMRELDVQEARELRTHLQTCEGCRQYMEEISGVTETLAAAETTSDLQTTESFHRKVLAGLQADESVSVWETAGIFFRGSLLNWRVALPVIAVSIMLIVGLAVQRHQSSGSVSLHTQPPAQIVSAPDANADLLPTIANYQMVANQSLQKLDELLDQQAKRTLPSTPVYTASMLALPNSSY